jgi:hypothetical protein
MVAHVYQPEANMRQRPQSLKKAMGIAPGTVRRAWRVAAAFLLAACVTGEAGQAQEDSDSDLPTWTYTNDLPKALSRATRLRVRTGGNVCCHLPTNETTIAEFTKPKDLRWITQKLRFCTLQRVGGCECCGGPCFEWYRGTNLIVLLSLHHGQALRWRDHWPGDAYLTDESARWLTSWLAKRGCTLPQRDLSMADERRRQYSPAPSSNTLSP